MRLPPIDHEKRITYLACVDAYQHLHRRRWTHAYRELTRRHPDLSPFTTEWAAAQCLKRNRTEVYLKSVEIRAKWGKDDVPAAIYGEGHELTTGFHIESEYTDADRVSEERRDFQLRSVHDIKSRILVDAELRERVVWYYVMNALRGGRE